MKAQQKYLTLFLSLCILLSVFMYFRMLQFLKEETPPLEFRYSAGHRETPSGKARKGKEPEPAPKSASPSSKDESLSFDINTADKDSLMDIPGVGPKMADTLIGYREKNGPFRKVEDLLEVPGIGPKKLETMKPYLENLEAGSAPKNKSGRATKPLLCPNCGADVPVDNTKNGHEKPYCLECLHYLSAEKP